MLALLLYILVVERPPTGFSVSFITWVRLSAPSV